MVIIEDTRNQKDKHKGINAYLKHCGHEVVRSKMLVGDYQIAGNGGVAVDTKRDVLELIQDVYKDHERFRRECQLAQRSGIRLYILVEEKLPEGGLNEWVSPKYASTTERHKKGDPVTRADPKRLRKALITMQEKYGVKFLFCDKRSTGRMIIKLLESDKSK